MKKYDYLIVGSGLFGATCANLLTESNKKCLIIEKRNHIGGNVYTKKIENIDVHIYGPHIFNTKNETIWNYVNQFDDFLEYKHIAKAKYDNKLYSLPFNMHTFQELWGITTKEEAIKKLEQEKINIENPKNLEEQALKLVGKEIYEKFIYGYTKKQWMEEPKNLPAFIIKRIPIRFEYDNNYHDSIFSGIPKNGYSKIIEKMLEKSDILLNKNYLEDKKYYNSLAEKIIYTGPIDELFDNKFGELEYRSLKFEHKTLNIDNFQNYSQVNYTSTKEKFTRIIEHKHFLQNKSNKTIITYEYPTSDNEKYYPINNEKNNKIYAEYNHLIKKYKNIINGGRLGSYSYLNMDQTIASAINTIKLIKNN